MRTFIRSDYTRAAHKSAGFLFGFSAPAGGSPHEIASFSPPSHLLNIRNSIIMIIMLDFICEPDAHSIDIYLTDISDQSECLRNFRTAHRASQLNDRVTFRLRDSDIIFEKEMTMMNEKIFFD